MIQIKWYYNGRSKRMKLKKNLFLWGILTIILFLCIMPSTVLAEGEEYAEQIQKPTRVKVLRLIKEEREEMGENSGYQVMHQYWEVQVVRGDLKGTKFTARSSTFQQSAYKLEVKAGDEALVLLEYGEDGSLIGGNIYEVARDRYLLYILFLFAATLVIIGGVKGIKSLISLVFTAFAIIKIMFPLILRGYSPIWVSVCISVVIALVTFIIVSGWNKKTLCAAIGTSSGVLFAGAITIIVGVKARLTGLGMEEAQMLQYIPQGTNFDFRGLLFAGILLGTLGAAMDVSMSIASSLYEIQKVDPKIDSKSLIKAGMNVGRDIMGTMSNTLILAYVGTSVPLILLYLAYDIPLADILNRDFIATEVIRSLVGSIGLFLTVPFTSFVSGTIGKNISIKG
jgi:uncharacterized membrane protein